METRGDANSKKRKATEEAAAVDELVEDGDEDLEDEEGVNPVAVMEGSKHGDGSLYEPKVDLFRWLYKLEDTSETSMQPMRLTHPTADCLPTSTSACGQHVGGPTLQIFSVKLAKLPRSAAAGGGGEGPIRLYGFMAVRDLMDPLRNYVFNRSRDDPLVIQDRHADPFVYLPGPKRAVLMEARVLFEYDVRIKGGEKEYQDLPLIDGVAIFSERTCIDEPAAHRIRGDGGGAVDVSWALITGAVEATVQVWIQELAPQHGNGDAGLDLSVSGFVPKIAEEIKLFRGVIEKPCAIPRFLVAARLDSDLVLHFKALAAAAAGAGSSHRVGEFAFKGAAHGSVSECRNFGFATVEVKVTWSALF